MKILIDTQVFIWLINKDEKLGIKALDALGDVTNQLYISYFSIFEMTIKAGVGKLDYDPKVIDDLPKMGIELLYPNGTTLQGYRIFNEENRDPFDNSLITTAINEGCILITSDPKILAASVAGLVQLMQIFNY